MAPTPTSASDSMLNQPIGTNHSGGSVPPLSTSKGWTAQADSKSLGSVPTEKTTIGSVPSEDACEADEICDQKSPSVSKPGNSEAKTTPEKVTEKALSEPTQGATTGQTNLATPENRPPVNAELTEPPVEPSAGELDREVLELPVVVEPVENGLLPCAKVSVALEPYGQFSYLNCDDGTTKFQGFTTEYTDTTPGTVVCDPFIYEKAKGCLVAQGSGWRFVSGSEAMNIVKGGVSGV